MISLFNGKRRLFSFPKEWANSVAKWISGVHSPNGTIEVTNTLNPGDDGSLGLDVNLSAVTEGVKRKLGLDKRGILDRNDVRDVVWDMADGESVVVKNRRVSVGQEWLQKAIDNPRGDASEPQDDLGEVSPSGRNTYSTASVFPLDAHSWTRGGGAGIKVRVCSRAKYVSSGTGAGEMAFFFRELEFDSTGRLKSVGEEIASYGVVSMQFYNA